MDTLVEERDINVIIKGFKIFFECIDFMIDEASTSTKREVLADDEPLPTTIQKVVGEGNRESSEEGNENTYTS